MKIASCQLKVELDLTQNVKRAKELITKAANDGADVIVLPEMFCCPYDNKSLKNNAQKGDGELVLSFCNIAKQFGIWVVLGSIPELCGDKIYNTCFVLNPKGEIETKYQKIHLFDIDMQDVKNKESDCITHGDKLCIFNTQFGKFGVAICFDLRFAEQFIEMGVGGAGVIFLPAAFNPITGKRDWETLIRARSLDSQAFIVSCSQARDSKPNPVYGYSSVVSPSGEIVGAIGEDEEILMCDIDFSEVDKARRTLPTISSRLK